MTSVPRPSKIVCAGRNYHAHAAEMGNVVPAEPLIFFKPPSSLVGEGEAIVIPPGVGRVDYEGEIAVRIGKRASKIREDEGWSYVDAVLPLNDVTARDLQRSDSQWSRAKGCDTFCPVGPPVPLSEVDLGSLTVVTRLNGEERQRGEIGEMVFSVPALLAYITRYITLEPGDLVSTGAPEGVGPLTPGDRVEVELVGYASVSNPVAADATQAGKMPGGAARGTGGR